jgi:hypothetical protein
MQSGLGGALAGEELEATTGIEPVMEVLQTSALPLGYMAPGFEAPSRVPVLEGGSPGRLDWGRKDGAEDEIRTRDPLLGKEVLYH